MISLLQLNTRFPRLPADVACPETYACKLEKLVVDRALVSNIVSDDLGSVPISDFVEMIKKARGDLITTSCGFLSCWQMELEKHAPAKFISSALLELPIAFEKYAVEDVAVLTFNAKALTQRHFHNLLPSKTSWNQLQIIGLDPQSHLRTVIENDELTLNKELAEAEVIELLERHFRIKKPSCIVLECTNLPPYKAAIRAHFNIEVYDILSAIERRLPNSIQPEYL